MDDQMDNDRRRLQRFSIKALAILRTLSVSRSQTFNLVTRDISSGGAFFLMALPLPVGEKVKVTIFLTIAALEGVADGPSQTRIVTDGRVVRSEAAGVAVRFSRRYKMAPVAV